MLENTEILIFDAEGVRNMDKIIKMKIISKQNETSYYFMASACLYLVLVRIIL